MKASAIPRFVKQSLATACVVTLLGVTATARAQASADDLGRRHFDSGTAYLEQAEYEDALREFRKAYELSKRAEILINVATVQERMADLSGAVATLEEYLQADPSGSHAETVRIRIDNLKKRLEREPPATEAPVEEAPPPPEAASQPAPAAAPEPVSDGPAAEGSSGPGWPVYALFGVAGASAIGAVVTGLLAQGEYNDNEDACAPGCTDDELSAGRTLAVTSTVLTGVAVLAGGVGAVLFLTSRPAEQANTSRPTLGFTAGPNSAMARARWQF